MGDVTTIPSSYMDNTLVSPNYDQLDKQILGERTGYKCGKILMLHLYAYPLHEKVIKHSEMTIFGLFIFGQYHVISSPFLSIFSIQSLSTMICLYPLPALPK